MNVFELALVASPVVGAISGALSVTGHQGSAMTLAGAFAGLLVGVAVFPGPLLLATWVFGRRRFRKMKPGRTGQWLLGTGIVLYATVAPLLAGFASHVSVSGLQHWLGWV
jgi:ABC-type transport system involved in cytochrome c biogenesis permease component